MFLGLKAVRYIYRENDGGEKMKNNAGSGAIYGLGFLGALVYFIQHATSLWDALVGIFYAIFWPGVILYKVLEILHM